MLYELHITVDHTRTDFELAAWQEFCREASAKPLDIRLRVADPPLAHGRQVMFAATMEGSDAEAADWQARMSAEVRLAGFRVLREKLEVPLDKSAPYADPAYHECHVKAFVPKNEVEPVTDALTAAGWMASWNDLNFVQGDLSRKLYFTWRVYRVNYIQAGRDFADVFSVLAETCHYTVRMESETVLEDSNPNLDNGW